MWRIRLGRTGQRYYRGCPQTLIAARRAVLFKQEIPCLHRKRGEVFHTLHGFCISAWLTVQEDNDNSNSPGLPSKSDMVYRGGQHSTEQMNSSALDLSDLSAVERQPENQTSMNLYLTGKDRLHPILAVQFLHSVTPFPCAIFAQCKHFLDTALCRICTTSEKKTVIYTVQNLHTY